MKIVFYDSDCNLCDGFIQFILNNNSSKSLKIAPLFGSNYDRLLNDSQLNLTKDSIILYENGKVYMSSKAVIKIINELNTPYRWLSVFRFFPKAMLEMLYGYVAKNRYRWFGKREFCQMPSLENRSRILD
jgi:predicted DCC family thiol-disulfide oxidoreductase YuxK